MIAVRRFYLVFSAVLAGILFVGLGVTGYRLIGESDPRAELFLYVSLVGAAAAVLLFTAGILRAEALDRRLDRLISRGTRKDILPGRDFAALGSLGEKLDIIFGQITRQNQLKSQKISALSDLVEFLVRNQERAVAVCDVGGTVRFMSDEWAEKTDSNRLEIIGESISGSLEDFSMETVAPLLQRTRQPSGGSAGKREYVCYPIEDRTGLLTYIAVFIDAKARFYNRQEGPAVSSAARSTKWMANLGRFLARKR